MGVSENYPKSLVILANSVLVLQAMRTPRALGLGCSSYLLFLLQTQGFMSHGSTVVRIGGRSFFQVQNSKCPVLRIKRYAEDHASTLAVEHTLGPTCKRGNTLEGQRCQPAELGFAALHVRPVP